MIDEKLIQDIHSTIKSGYYERRLIPRRERKSLVDALEKSREGGKVPIILELMCASPKRGQFFTNKMQAVMGIESVLGFEPAALSYWVEPRRHAGDLRWLVHERKMPIIARDYIISPKQMVGGDAVWLSLPLLHLANADPHELVEAAHEEDFEVVMEVFTNDDLKMAKQTEADVLAVNNYGPNGNPADINTTLEMLRENGTGRPVISAEGIEKPEQVRDLVKAGVDSIILGPHIWSIEGGKDILNSLSKAGMGRDPKEPLKTIEKMGN